MLRQTLETILDATPQQRQRQDSTIEQLADLRTFANKLGMYDAADYIRNVVEQSQGKLPVQSRR